MRVTQKYLFRRRWEGKPHTVDILGRKYLVQVTVEMKAKHDCEGSLETCSRCNKSAWQSPDSQPPPRLSMLLFAPSVTRQATTDSQLVSGGVSCHPDYCSRATIAGRFEGWEKGCVMGCISLVSVIIEYNKSPYIRIAKYFMSGC